MKIIKTGQTQCFDQKGRIIPCPGTGQDGEFQKGICLRDSRFNIWDTIVSDQLTGLLWTKQGSLSEFPLSWSEVLDFVKKMNTAGTYGYSDWRLPNRRELFSLINHSNINPSLAQNTFLNAFSGYYWTSTTCCRLPSQAWYIHLGGARVFKGMKHGSYMVWPVRSGKASLTGVFQTGQTLCYDDVGNISDCHLSGQDGALLSGIQWPRPRFESIGETVLDQMTGLIWACNANLPEKPLNWMEALNAVKVINSKRYGGFQDWRLPNIRELESLTCMGTHSPALPREHPFQQVKQFYWSSTTSQYETTYAWVLYLQDGNLGVGFKQKPEFFVWPVKDATSNLQPRKQKIF